MNVKIMALEKYPTTDCLTWKRVNVLGTDTRSNGLDGEKSENE